MKRSLQLLLILAVLAPTGCGVVEKVYECRGVTNVELMADNNPGLLAQFEEAKRDTAKLSKSDEEFLKALNSDVVLNIRAIPLQDKQSVLLAMSFKFDTAQMRTNSELTRCKVFDGDNWSCLDWLKTDRDSSNGWMAVSDSDVMAAGQLHFVGKGYRSRLKCEAHAQLGATLKTRFAWLAKW